MEAKEKEVEEAVKEGEEEAEEEAEEEGGAAGRQGRTHDNENVTGRMAEGATRRWLTGRLLARRRPVSHLSSPPVGGGAGEWLTGRLPVRRRPVSHARGWLTGRLGMRGGVAHRSSWYETGSGTPVVLVRGGGSPVVLV